MHWVDSWFFGMHLLWWVFWIVLFATLFSLTTPVPKGRAGSPLETLQRRYARGEIDTAEYEERKARLVQERAPDEAASRLGKR